ncbi:MAG: LysR substrate-binding domain-containing protein [Roseobacter sp.]
MTPVGLDLAERVRGILAEVRDFETRAPRENNAGTTTLRLGMIPTVGPFLMPRAMALLRSALPETKIYLREELTDLLAEGLMDGRLDLLLIALPQRLPPHVETEILFSDGYAMVTPPDHPLANRATVGADDLADRHLLLLEREHCLQRHALSSLTGINPDEHQSFSATSLSTLVAMVEAKLGITLLSKIAADAGISRGHKLHMSDVEGARPRQVSLEWRKSTPHVAFYKKVGACLATARAQMTEKSGQPEH